MEQPREPKSSSETENKESKVKVGQQSFNNYLKVQADELEAQGVHVKRDNEFKRSIASKWKTLTPYEKAKYCVPNANDSSKLTKKCKEQPESPTTISTRCSPQMFQQVVSKFSEEQTAAITELGFGNLLQLSCTRVRRDLCGFLIGKLDTENCQIELHGKTMEVNSLDFNLIMSVPEGGSDVKMNDSIDDPDMKRLVDHYGGTSGYIQISDIVKKIDGTNQVDEHFRVNFMLFALGTLLCPTTATRIPIKFLLPLKNVNQIRSLNWASFSFNFLLESVRSYKQKKSPTYISGCVLFLQLYYFNVIGYGRSIVDCSKPIIASWGDETSSKLVKFVREKGGYDSPIVIVAKLYSFGGQETRNGDVIAIRNEVHLLRDVIARLEIKIDGFPQILQEALDNVLGGDRYQCVKKKEAYPACKVVEPSGNDIGERSHQKPHARIGNDQFDVDDDSSCRIYGEFLPNEGAPPTGRKQHVKSNKIMNETKTSRISPINTRRTDERFPSQAMSSPYVKIDRNLRMLSNVSLNLQRLGDFKGPFKFNDDDCYMLSFIFAEFDDKFIVFRTDSIHLTRGDIRCLDPGQLVSNTLITAVQSILREPWSPQWFIGPYLSESAILAEGQKKLTEFAHKAQETFNYDFRDTTLEECEKIFIPVLDRGVPTNHWFLLVVNIPRQEAELWDSFPCPARETARKELASILLKTLDIIFEDDIATFFDGEWLFSSFELFRPDYVPVQPNAFDCGIYTIKFMEDFENASNACDKFDSETERLRIALKLVKHPDNQARVDIDKATEDQEKEDGITNLGKKRKRKQEDISTMDNDTVLHTKQVHAKTQEHDKTQAHAKRGRGRPRGSTNKKKFMRNTD